MIDSTGYRRDIDGLRAVAVLSVVFYHYGVPGFGGGFIGVDVFFVISGYLIGGHIANELDAGRFSLRNFYERRIRRICPALFFMLTSVTLAAAVVLFPPDLHAFARDALFVIPFLANVEFYKAAGAYGAPFSQQIVLLHTWSLAVEEQFYVLFPLLMLAAARFVGRRYWLVLAPLAIISFVLCALAARIAPIAAFYLTPFRGWELLLGALVVLLRPSPHRNPKIRSVLAISGLALIALSDALLTNRTPFPSEYALLPCGGAALLLYAACDNELPVGRVLDNPAAVRIGLWSYSLYLFHWPLLVLARYYAFEPLSISTRILLFLATLMLAALSWRFVERPFRDPNKLHGSARLYIGAFLSAGGIFLGAIFLQRAYSSPQWLTPRERALFPVHTEAQNRCTGSTPGIATDPSCTLGDASKPADTILWGDSHALAMLPAVAAVFAEHKDAVAFAERGACPPLLGVQLHPPRRIDSPIFLATLSATGLEQGDACEQHNDDVLRWVIEKRIATVILAGHWRTYASADQNVGVLFLSDKKLPRPASLAGNPFVFQRGFERLLEALNERHIRIFIVEDVPEIDANVPYTLASAERLGRHPNFALSPRAYETQQLNVTQIFTAMQSRHAFSLLRPQDLLCTRDACAVTQHGRSLYEDGEHLSPAGAAVVEPIFEKLWQ